MVVTVATNKSERISWEDLHVQHPVGMLPFRGSPCFTASVLQASVELICVSLAILSCWAQEIVRSPIATSLYFTLDSKTK